MISSSHLYPHGAVAGDEESGRQSVGRSMSPLDRLELVRVSNVAPHEAYHLKHHADLACQISEERILRNPILALRKASGFVLLDGTHRLEYSRTEGLEWIPCQVADPATVRICSWAHLMLRVDEIAFIDDLKLLLHLQEIAAADAEAALCAGKLLFYVALNGEDRAFACLRTKDPTPSLRVLTDAYDGAVPRRIAPEHYGVTFSPGAVFAREGSFNVVVRYGVFSGAEVLGFVNDPVPAGITRAVPEARLLGVNAPLTLLRGASTAMRRSWVSDVLLRPCVRYPGPVDVLEGSSRRRYIEDVVTVDPEIKVFSARQAVPEQEPAR